MLCGARSAYSGNQVSQHCRMSKEDLLSKYEFIVNTSQELMTMIDRTYRYVAANKAYCAAHNRNHESVIGSTVGEIWGTEKLDDVFDYLEQCFKGRNVHYESWFEFPALGERCFEVYCYPFFEDQTVTHIVVISRDITERKKLEEKVFVDSLTGLYNYRYLNQRIEEEFERALRYDLNLSVVFIDIDNFKSINDALGHQTANEILRDLAGIMAESTPSDMDSRASLRKADIAGRYGGEEFVILLPETTKENAQFIAERLRRQVEAHDFFHYQNQPGTRVTISLGIAAFPNDLPKNPGDLLRKADLAMYDAKHRGRNRVSLYDN